MELKKFSLQDFNNYLEGGENNYANEIAASRNITFEEALKISKEEFKKTLPDGFNTKDNYFYKMIVNDNEVGMIWICKYIENNMTRAFIYEINVKEKFQGKGYAKKAIKLIETEAKKLQAHTIGLHVFYRNEIAYNLYKKLGYIETKTGKKSAEMEKKLQ